MRTSISGFPEWLPQEQFIENRFIEIISSEFERSGYAPLRTRAVEPVDLLLKKGETDKEIYLLQRLHADRVQTEGKLGLHFDLTVPLARFVADNVGSLVFPFRRYQIQPAWRGERPQDGRYREFLQADADIVCRNTLPLHHDVEMAILLAEILERLPIPRVTIHVNNRKVLEGFCEGLGIDDVPSTLRTVDKLAKVGEEKMTGLLRESLSGHQAGALVRLSQIRSADDSFVTRVRELGVSSAKLDEGLEELAAILQENVHLAPGSICADLSIARGLDYYTGTVYEGMMQGFERVGAVCSGGRYDNLVQAGGRASGTYPGVGISIGISRILGLLLGRGYMMASRSTPTCVLVALNDDRHLPLARAAARRLRERGIAAEVFNRPVKYGQQIRYATRKGIPYVLFHDAEVGNGYEIRDLERGRQSPCDLETWNPAPEHRHPRVSVSSSAPIPAGDPRHSRA